LRIDRGRGSHPSFEEYRRMSNIEFGLVATLTGMGVTLVTLYVLTLVIRLMNRIFPDVEPKEGQK
jgi:Na+-transporting methylmalonyl-CoA/oxaloacetate decarboxylase gamma subunit